MSKITSPLQSSFILSSAFLMVHSLTGPGHIENSTSPVQYSSLYVGGSVKFTSKPGPSSVEDSTKRTKILCPLPT